MGIIELIITSFGVSMDAFATSICKGLTLRKINIKNCMIVGLYFGVFQAIMPLIGHLLGSLFGNVIVKFDHWVAFVLLGIIGFNMLKEAFYCEDNKTNCDLSFKAMLPLAVATSIDALAVGITFAFLKVNIVLSIILIGVITFGMSFIGVKLGSKFGDKYEKNAQILGGVILIAMGLKILLSHLGIL